MMSFRINNDVDHTKNSYACFRRYREEGHLCDVILEAVSEENAVCRISAHRVVLSAEIPYFKIMFDAGMRESSQKSITINGIQPDILQAVVAYAYGQEVCLPRDRIGFLLSAADFLQMLSLRQKCSTCLQSMLGPDNCLEIRAVAEVHNCPDLYQACTAYARIDFERVTSCEDYLSLFSGQLKDLISSDKVLVSNEEQVYTALINWVYYDLERRKDEFPDLMSHVRLPFVSLNYLYQVVEKEPLVQNNSQCLNYVQEAYMYKNFREKRGLLEYTSRLKPRNLPGIDDMLVTVGGLFIDIQYQTCMEKYDPLTNNWTIFGEITEPISNLCTCYYNGYIYVMGGTVKEMVLNRLERYDIVKQKWETMMPMKETRENHSACVLYGLIYVTGGMNQVGHILSSTECYNPDSNSWVEVAPMTTCRMNHGMTDVGCIVFVAGGYDGPNVFGTAEFYDPSVNYWTPTPCMSVPRYGLGVASLGSVVYAVAGQYNNDTVYNIVDCYDTEKGVWTTFRPLKVPRSCMGVVKYHDTLYVCGGSNVEGYETSVEKYNPTSESWEFCASMIADKFNFGIIST